MTTPTMTCSWCGCAMGACEVEHSHGICAECIAKYFPEYADEMKEGNDEG